MIKWAGYAAITSAAAGILVVSQIYRRIQVRIMHHAMLKHDCSKMPRHLSAAARNPQIGTHAIGCTP